MSSARDLLAAQVALHQGLVGLDDGVEQLRAVFLDGRGELVRDRDRVALALAVRVEVRAVVQQVDDAGQFVLGADRQLDRDAAVGELLLHRGQHPEEVGALAVEHVDVDDPGELELLRPVPHARRVHLDSHHTGDDDQRALDHAQGGNRVGLETGVARRVDQIELAALPLTRAERRGQRHLAPLLVLVPVRDGRPRLDRAEPVRLARLEEQSLDERGLARSAVSDDGNVADLPGFDGHRVLLGAWNGSRESYAPAGPRASRPVTVWSEATAQSIRTVREPQEPLSPFEASDVTVPRHEAPVGKFNASDVCSTWP